MRSSFRKFTLCLAPAFLLFANGVDAGSAELDRAIEKYYAGYPEQAIDMIKPLATSGDVDAQLLLGNILYGLSGSSRISAAENPARWYRMAARQDSAQANYALGAIHNNNWLKSRKREDADLAQRYFQKAVDLGYTRARAPLNKLAAQFNPEQKLNSLTYTNSSFDSKRKLPTKPEKTPKKNSGKLPASSALADFKPSDDPAADARKLLALLKEIGYIGDSNGAARPDNNWLDETTLSRLLAGIESADEIVGDLVNLLDHLQSPTEPDQAPGSN